MIMYDSVTAADIPASAQMVAGYINGRYAWSQADWDRFPNAIKLRISVFASEPADVLDVEPGDADVTQAPAWIQLCQANGIAKPIIYCSVSNLAQITSLCAGLTYRVWTAHYTGQPHITPGADMTQYTDPTYGSGGHWDLTAVSDAWLAEWQADHPVATAPASDPALAYVPQEYQDKFGAKTPADVYANLEGIISSQMRTLAAIKALCP